MLDNVMNTIINNGLQREVFLSLFRYSDELNDQLTSDDCMEIFMGILKGSKDLTRRTLDELCSNYDVDLDEVIKG